MGVRLTSQNRSEDRALLYVRGPESDGRTFSTQIIPSPLIWHRMTRVDITERQCITPSTRFSGLNPVPPVLLWALEWAKNGGHCCASVGMRWDPRISEVGVARHVATASTVNFVSIL